MGYIKESTSGKVSHSHSHSLRLMADAGIRIRPWSGFFTVPIEAMKLRKNRS